MLIPIDLPLPAQGVFLRHNPDDIPRAGAARLHNLRVDEGLVLSRPGTQEYHTAPDAKRVIDGFTLKMRDGTVRALRCVADGTRYDTGTAWNAVTLDAAWTGAAQDRFWAVVAPWGGTAKGRIIISNGIGIKQWDGVPANTMTALASAPPGRYGLVGPDQRVFSMWVKSGGDQPRLVQWSVPLLPNGGALDWTDPGSGAIEVNNDSSEITATWVQNERVFVGKERSVVALDPTGLPRDAYGLSPIASSGKFEGDGPLPGSVAQFGNAVAMISYRDVLLFDGTNFTPVGGPVIRELIRRLNYAALRSIATVVDSANGRVGWGLPLDGASSPSEIWWLDIRSGRWETESRPHSTLFLHGFSSPIVIDGLTAAYPPGKIDDLGAIKINALSPAATAPPKIMVGRTDGRIGYISDDTASDFGDGVTGDYRSPTVSPIGIPMADPAIGGQRAASQEDFFALDRVTVRLADRGETYEVDVRASTDGGATWESLGSVTMTSTVPEDVRRLVKAHVTARYPANAEVQIRLTNKTAGAKWGFGVISLSLDPVGRTV